VEGVVEVAAAAAAVEGVKVEAYWTCKLGSCFSSLLIAGEDLRYARPRR
jgi:hypothetical protein